MTTWVLPATFMVAMAWGCETHARQLGRRALLFYDGDADSAQAAIAAAKQRKDKGHDKREILRASLLVLSIAVPIGFVAYADHVHARPASTGSARSARSSRSPSSSPRPSSPTGDDRNAHPASDDHHPTRPTAAPAYASTVAVRVDPPQRVVHVGSDSSFSQPRTSPHTHHIEKGPTNVR